MLGVLVTRALPSAAYVRAAVGGGHGVGGRGFEGLTCVLGLPPTLRRVPAYVNMRYVGFQ